MEHLRYLVVVGLVFDAVGFWIVVRYGPAIFTHVNSRPPFNHEGRDGDEFIVVNDPMAAQGHLRRRRFAHQGVWLVLLGFALQVVGFLF